MLQRQHVSSWPYISVIVVQQHMLSLDFQPSHLPLRDSRKGKRVEAFVAFVIDNRAMASLPWFSNYHTLVLRVSDG